MLIKEIACELSTPVADILNASVREGQVPRVWKDATIDPVPKEMPATITKFRPSRRLYMLSRLKRFGVPVEDLVSVYNRVCTPDC